MSDTIYQRIGRLLSEGVAPEVAAAMSLDGMTKAQLIEFVRPEVERLARTIDRSRVRRVEHRTLPVTDGKTSPDGLSDLLAECFLLPDDGFVRWGEATAEQHERRAVWQRSNAAEIIADAERHEWAATLIRSAGATCLNDLGVSALEVPA